MKRWNWIPLMLVGLVATTGCVSSPEVRLSLEPESEARVELTGPHEARVRNSGPGRLGVRFGPEVLVWIHAGGRVEHRSEGDSVLILTTEHRRTRCTVSAKGASAIRLVESPSPKSEPDSPERP